jgi:hypothetical protein
MLKRHPSGVIIDCSGLTAVTPKGASTFRDVMEFIRNQDARVIVAAVPLNIREVLSSVAEVRSQLAIADSVDDARRSLDLLVVEKPGKKKAAFVGESKILVCLSGTEIDKETLKVAAQLGIAREAELHLLFAVLVPRDLPLTAPLPKEEAIASRVIEQSKIALEKQISYVPHVERGRDIPTTVEELANELKASLVIFPLVSNGRDADAITRLMCSLLARIPQEVILVRGPAEKPVATR